MNKFWFDAIVTFIASLLVFMLADAFPRFGHLIWLFAGSTALLVIYLGIRKPVNYVSLFMDENGFRHEGMHHEVIGAKWNDVIDVFFVRDLNPFTNDYETEWEVHLRSGSRLRILVEWVHRRKFASFLERHVQGFQLSLAMSALKERSEGRWHCFVPNNSFQRTPDGAAEQ